jgi:hypothetical protein
MDRRLVGYGRARGGPPGAFIGQPLAIVLEGGNVFGNGQGQPFRRRSPRSW